MGYVGTGKIKLNPKHPFASLQIGFGVKPPPNSSGASQTPKATPSPEPEESSTNQAPAAAAADSTPGAHRSADSDRSAGG